MFMQIQLPAAKLECWRQLDHSHERHHFPTLTTLAGVDQVQGPMEAAPW